MCCVVDSDVGITDTCVSGTALAAAVEANAAPGSGKSSAHAGPVATAAANADTLGAELALVGDAAGGQRVGSETVLAVLDRLLGTGNLATVEIGVALDVELEAVIAGFDTRLLADAGKVGLDSAVAGVGAARETEADREVATEALVFAVVGTGVLPAGDVEVVADSGADLFAADDGTIDGAVVAGIELYLLSAGNMAHGLGHIAAIGLAATAGGVGGDTKGGAVLAEFDCQPGAVGCG